VDAEISVFLFKTLYQNFLEPLLQVQCMDSNQESHAFSVELNHKGSLKNISLPHREDKKTVIEGFLGQIESIRFVESAMLEIQGTNGIFRIDLTTQDIAKILHAAAKEVRQ
jgi:hypothetical protein